MAVGLSIRDLADRALVSKTSVVALEQGHKCRPSTLVKVCSALNLHLDRLLDAPQPADGLDGVPWMLQDYGWYALDDLSAGPSQHQTHPARMAMFKNVPADAGFIAGVIRVEGSTHPRQHIGAEMVCCLRGVAKVSVNGTDYVLQPGESLFIPEGAEHSYAPNEPENGPIDLISIRTG